MTYRKFAWPFSFYFLIFAGMATYRPYLVLYYQSLSFTGTQIGLLVGIAPLITMVSLPLVTGLADRMNRHKLIMSLTLLVLLAVLIVFPFLTTFIPLLSMAVLSTVFFAPIMALSNSAAMFMLGDRKDLYGRIRWEVVSFVSITLQLRDKHNSQHGKECKHEDYKKWFTGFRQRPRRVVYRHRPR